MVHPTAPLSPAITRAAASALSNQTDDATHLDGHGGDAALRPPISGAIPAALPAHPDALALARHTLP
jgi:hypothetical protein